MERLLNASLADNRDLKLVGVNIEVDWLHLTPNVNAHVLLTVESVNVEVCVEEL